MEPRVIPVREDTSINNDHQNRNQIISTTTSYRGKKIISNDSETMNHIEYDIKGTPVHNNTPDRNDKFKPNIRTSIPDGHGYSTTNMDDAKHEQQQAALMYLRMCIFICVYLCVHVSCMYVYVCVCMDICVHVYVCIYVCVYVFVCMCVFVCLYVCV